MNGKRLFIFFDCTVDKRIRMVENLTLSMTPTWDHDKFLARLSVDIITHYLNYQSERVELGHAG